MNIRVVTHTHAFEKFVFKLPLHDTHTHVYIHVHTHKRAHAHAIGCAYVSFQDLFSAYNAMCACVYVLP